MSVPAWADGCEKFDYKRIMSAVVTAARATGVDPYHLRALLKVETNYGKNAGVRAGAAYSKLSRDGIPLVVLADIHGKKPSEVCASRVAIKSGFGGAIGVAQMLPSTWADLIGLVVDTQGVRFSSWGGIQRVDAIATQRILNALYRFTPLTEDGVWGAQTKGRLSYFHRGVGKGGGYYAQWMSHCPRYLKRRALSPCTKMAMLDSIRWSYRYDPRKDRVASALQVKGPANPWIPEHAVVGMALLLKDFGWRKDPASAVGAYRAGEGWERSESRVRNAARDHIQKVNRELRKVNRKL